MTTDISREAVERTAAYLDGRGLSNAFAAAAKLRALRKELDEAVGLLRPFGRLADQIDDNPASRPIGNRAPLCVNLGRLLQDDLDAQVGDLRAAAAFLSRHGGSNGK